MRTVEVTLYQLSELSEKAQERAYNKWLQHGDNYGWHDENRESLEAFAKLFPINVSNWSYGDRDYGVSFSFTDYHHYDIDAVAALSGVRLATWLWNNLNEDIYTPKYYKSFVRHENYPHHRNLSRSVTKAGDNAGKIRLTYKSRLFRVGGQAALTGVMSDEYLLDPIYKFIARPDASVDMEDLLTDCFGEWVKYCNQDVEYAHSMEAFKESAEANEYEFDENGEMQ